MRQRTLSLIAALALGKATIALAQPEARPSAPPPVDPELAARELYRQGSLLYEQARFDEAIARFNDAYRLSGRPALLFNIAQAYRLKGPSFCAVALTYYERDLQQEPGTSNRGEIEDLMNEMRACADRAAPPALPAVAVPPSGAATATPVASVNVSPPQAEKPSRWPVWLAISGGGLALAGAVGHGVAYGKYRSVRTHGPVAPGTYSEWETFTTVSDAVLATGAALSVTGLIVLWSTASRDGEPQVAVGVAPRRRPALELTMHF